MTPQEKALQLAQKMGWTGFEEAEAEFTTLPLSVAKKCALISVEETLETLSVIGPEAAPDAIFWTEVKIELNKL